MNRNVATILIALGALVLGGAAVAAYMSRQAPAPAAMLDTASLPEAVSQAQDDVAAVDNSIPEPVVEYARVLSVAPVTSKEKVYATVIGSEAVRETTTTTTPHEVCEDVVIEERAPEKDGNVGGTVAGAVIGGVLGHQVGGGNGKKAATAAGAVVGGIVGNKIDKNHQGGEVTSRTERQCHTEQASSESTRVTGYNVTYRNPDGTTGTMRMDKKPGNSIPMGSTDKVLGYDVTYRLGDEEKTIRMDSKPAGDSLPVIDGKVMVAAAGEGDQRGG
ncbi:hypothetical protein CSC70_08290 [Pseudoxanthomonas kalamensis DSM 18571]|uniref:glycine zipper 2TM domain-containing protein n=1 Tax=Pseudoxanthomonas kalamensis TaxID=289483 RepID=UPI001391EA6E|nr:glycine zipper 2TM domain-containing protein [Pseudoxanthomonas kalamensis]KAF1710639.1 hypothetical protein CSC70_08290 [Pseudoxanthomonas kalamensis DSM 18571]